MLKVENHPCTQMGEKYNLIMKLKLPKYLKDFRLFCGMLNFLPSFPKDLKKNQAHTKIQDTEKEKQILMD